jgi:ribosomal protein L16/L10AE
VVEKYEIVVRSVNDGRLLYNVRVDAENERDALAKAGTSMFNPKDCHIHVARVDPQEARVGWPPMGLTPPPAEGQG